MATSATTVLSGHLLHRETCNTQIFEPMSTLAIISRFPLHGEPWDCPGSCPSSDPAIPPGQPQHRAYQETQLMPDKLKQASQSTRHTRSTQRMTINKTIPSSLGEVVVHPKLQKHTQMSCKMGDKEYAPI